MSRLGSAFDRQRKWFTRAWLRLTGEWKPLVEQPVSSADLALTMDQASLPYFGFYFMLALATVIATFGLLANSVATIIGAMIIAPLMYPIMSLSFGMVLAQRQLIVRSIFTLLTGVVLVVGIALGSTELLGLRVAGSEILTRTRPTLLDLGVAFAAGGAGAFAYTRRSVFSAVAGVAIAVALVPPLAVVGIGLALGREASVDMTLAFSKLGQYSGVADVAGGALMLFLTNLSGIVAVSAMVFLIQGYGQWNRASLGIVFALAVAALLTIPLGVSLREMYVKSALLSTIAELVANHPDLYPGTSRLESIDVHYKNGLLLVDVGVVTPEDELRRSEFRIEALQQYLTEEVGEPVYLRMEVIPVKILEYEFPRRPALGNDSAPAHGAGGNGEPK